METYRFIPLFLLLSQEALCYVVGPIMALAAPIPTEMAGGSASSRSPLAKLIAPAKQVDLISEITRQPDIITYYSQPDSGLAPRRPSRPSRLVFKRTREISHVKIDSSAILFPAADDDPRFTTYPIRYSPLDDVSNKPSIGTGQNFPPSRAGEVFSSDNLPVIPGKLDDRISFDGPTSSETDTGGGRHKPPIKSFAGGVDNRGGTPGWASSSAPSTERRRRPEFANVPNWPMNGVGRPRPDLANVPNLQDNGGRTPVAPPNAPNWQGNGGRTPVAPPNAANWQVNGGRTPVAPPNAPNWQGNGGRAPGSAPPTSTSEAPETTTPNCECPITSEFNPVCGEVEEERITFTNLNEFKCANICTQTEIRLLFHSSCGGVYSNQLYPLDQYTTEAPVEQASQRENSQS